jgi:hypothetical protein
VSPNASSPEAGEPVLRVVRGEPTPDELAALVAVVASRAAAAPPPAPPHKDVWRDRSRHVRPLLYPGPGRWVTSNWPR